MKGVTSTATVFLISPANLGGKRGKLLFSPDARFELARRLRSEGATVGDVFTFVSGLYFRGKRAYAERFGHAPGRPGAYVMTAGGGLCTLDERVSLGRLEGWRHTSVSEHNPHFTAPLVRQVCELAHTLEPEARFVLLGSVASRKYVAPLVEALGPRLLFPARLAGLGDMSRGSLLLRCVSANEELEYASIQAPLTKGSRSAT
jgi:hypothetical protein